MAIRMTAEEFAKLQTGKTIPRRNKFNAKKTEYDGIKFDSMLESRRYAELKMLERVGAIKDLVLQPRFEIIPKFTDNLNRKHKATFYQADFQYTLKDGKVVVEDTKSDATKTAAFKIKEKLFLLKYPDIDFRIIQD